MGEATTTSVLQEHTSITNIFGSQLTYVLRVHRCTGRSGPGASAWRVFPSMFGGIRRFSIIVGGTPGQIRIAFGDAKASLRFVSTRCIEQFMCARVHHDSCSLMSEVNASDS